MAEINLKVLNICLAYVMELTTAENRQEMKDLAEAIKATANQNTSFYNQNASFYRQMVQLLSKAYNEAMKLKCSPTMIFYVRQAIAFFQNKEDEARSAFLSERLRVIKAC